MPVPKTKAQIDALRAKLVRWRKAYHEDKGLVSDAMFDAAEDDLRAASPSDRYFKRVGAPVQASGKDKVVLPYLMPSLEKVRVGRGLEDWLEEATGDITVSDKLDGSSIGIENVNGKLRAFTRGNGKVGRNITHLLPKLKGIGRLARGETVRGEAVMSQADFDDYWSGEGYADNRGLVNGVINATTNAPKALKHIQFFAHGLMNPRIPWSKARVKLKAQGWTTAPTSTLRNPTPAALTTYFAKRQAASSIKLDGLVLENKMHHDAVSFKVDSAPNRAIVDRVVWELSRHNIYKPLVILRTPVKVGGVMLRKATGYNARYIVENKIGPGAVIGIIRSGDVIPKIVEVYKPTKPQLPSEAYVWDANKVDVIAGKLSSDQQLGVTAKRLAQSLVYLQIEGIREKSALVLAEAEFTDLVDLYAADADDFMDAGLGAVISDKLYAGLQAAKRKATHVQLMAASGCWPRGFSTTTFEKILDVIAYKQLVKMTKPRLIAAIHDIHGLSSAYGTVFAKHLPEYLDMLDELGWRPRNDMQVAISGRLLGQSFCFSGVRDKVGEHNIVAAGGKVSGSVSANTTVLVVKSLSGSSSKMVKAKALDVPIMTLERFKAKYKV